MDRVEITGGDARSFRDFKGAEGDRASIARAGRFGKIEIIDLYGNKTTVNKSSLLKFLNDKIGNGKILDPSVIAKTVSKKSLENGKLKEGVFSKADNKDIQKVFTLYLECLRPEETDQHVDDLKGPIEIAEEARAVAGRLKSTAAKILTEKKPHLENEQYVDMLEDLHEVNKLANSAISQAEKLGNRDLVAKIKNVVYQAVDSAGKAISNLANVEHQAHPHEVDQFDIQENQMPIEEPNPIRPDALASKAAALEAALAETPLRSSTPVNTDKALNDLKERIKHDADFYGANPYDLLNNLELTTDDHRQLYSEINELLNEKAAKKEQEKVAAQKEGVDHKVRAELTPPPLLSRVKPMIVQKPEAKPTAAPIYEPPKPQSEVVVNNTVINIKPVNDLPVHSEAEEANAPAAPKAPTTPAAPPIAPPAPPRPGDSSSSTTAKTVSKTKAHTGGGSVAEELGKGPPKLKPATDSKKSEPVKPPGAPGKPAISTDANKHIQNKLKGHQPQQDIGVDDEWDE